MLLSLTSLFAAEFCEYQRQQIAAGEWWRLVTGNWVHTNYWHLLLNGAGLVVLHLLFAEELQEWRLPNRLLLLSLLVGIGIYFFSPTTHWYRGLSGALHGLFIWSLLQDLYLKRRYSLLLLLGFILKIALDLFAEELTPTATLIAARVHWQSHLIGSAAGALCWVLTQIRAKKLLTI